MSGSRRHPGEAFDAALEDLAATIEANAGEKAMTIGFRGLATDASDILGLVTELVT